MPAASDVRSTRQGIDFTPEAVTSSGLPVVLVGDFEILANFFLNGISRFGRKFRVVGANMFAGRVSASGGRKKGGRS